MQYELVNIAQLRIFFKYIKKIFTQKAFKLSKYAMQHLQYCTEHSCQPKNHSTKTSVDSRTVSEDVRFAVILSAFFTTRRFQS